MMHYIREASSKLIFPNNMAEIIREIVPKALLVKKDDKFTAS